MSFLSIVIVNYNTRDLLFKCLKSIQTSSDSSLLEIIVVDNASNDNSVEMIEKYFPDVILVRNRKNMGFAYANNQGIRYSKGKYIILLNSDTEIVAKDFFKRIVYFFKKHPRCGIIGPLIRDSEGNIQNSVCPFPSLYTVSMQMSGLSYFFPGNIYFSPFREFVLNKKYTKIHEVDWVSGACLCFRRELLDTVGLLDDNFFLYYEETDFCWRVRRKGWKIYFIPVEGCVHHTGKTTSRYSEIALYHSYKSLLYYFKKHRYPFDYILTRILVLLNFTPKLFIFRFILKSRWNIIRKVFLSFI